MATGPPLVALKTMSRTLSLPSIISYDHSSNQTDTGSPSDLSGHKFPHTRAQLSAIVRQNKPLDSYDSDADGDEFSRVSSSFVSKVVSLLDNEQEDELKILLKGTYGMDDEMVEQNVLDLMHKHRDDIAGVPFLFLTPTRRPISRPSSRASSHSARLMPNRSETPISAPTSPLSLVFRRPQFPATSPLGAGAASNLQANARIDSALSSPVFVHAQAHSQFAISLPASPLSSPQLLNAKASEFKPIPRPLSAASSNPASLASLRAETPSPDLWAPSSLRASSNLAIAAPLIPEHSVLSRSSSSLRRSALRPPEDDDEDDPFDPFAQKAGPPSFHSITVSDFDSSWSNTWSNSSNSNSSLSPEEQRTLDSQIQFQQPTQDSDPAGAADEDIDADAAAMLMDGMTPFDVLSSVFGSTLAPSELEEALASNAYEFERAMAWLVDRALPAPPPSQQIRMQQMGARVTLVSRGRGLPGVSPPGSRGAAPRYVNGRTVPGGNRVCRYFIAGECLRADCRFSHDLERALCRFWLRGTCAKHENCEFLHHLPKDVDVSGLTAAMSRANLGPQAQPVAQGPPLDDFPALTFDNVVGGKAGRGGQRHRDAAHDPGRTRFAAAAKKQVPVPTSPIPVNNNDAAAVARREAMGASADSLHHRSAIVAPRPSPRQKLRPPLLLPTLPTGESVNALYMAYRNRALQLGAARNACLSRAADAWRRGDGAAAKRFSREGHDLNAKMSAEMTEAAGKIVRERAKLAEHAARSRDASWTNDAGDRSTRGKACGGGLGVLLGIASKEVGDGKLSPEERTESLLDLHGLHSNEATEILEQFLLSLEREHFYGLAYVVVGEEKHTGTQDAARGASRARLATGVREWVHRWGYPWTERDGVICIDPLTHA